MIKLCDLKMLINKFNLNLILHFVVFLHLSHNEYYRQLQLSNSFKQKSLYYLHIWSKQIMWFMANHLFVSTRSSSWQGHQVLIGSQAPDLSTGSVLLLFVAFPRPHLFSWNFFVCPSQRHRWWLMRWLMSMSAFSLAGRYVKVQY